MKLILSTFFSLICFGLFAQKDSVYTNINKALKNPLEVYSLFLYNAKDKQDYTKLSEFKNLESLSIISSGLTVFPESIYSCKKLTKLNLRNNYSLKIDERFQQLTELKDLNIPIVDSFQNFDNTIGKLKHLEKLHLTVHNFDICQVLVLSKLKELTIEYWSEDYFQVPTCSLKELHHLQNVRILTEDCCYPYIKVSPETIALVKSLLPVNCTFFGLTNGEEIRYDPNLR